MKSTIFHSYLCLLPLLLLRTGDAFSVTRTQSNTAKTGNAMMGLQHPRQRSRRLLMEQNVLSSEIDAAVLDCDDDDDENTDDPGSNPLGPVRAPLKFIGPYIGLGLNFPYLSTSSQRERNLTGIALDFVLDTAANINTLNAQVGQELELDIVGEAPGGISASGTMAGGHTFLLGSCELEGLNRDEDKFIFMENLTASALPVASPAAAGLLAMPFFHCFEGGVEFDWVVGGATNLKDGLQVPPSVTFYGSAEESSDLRRDMTRISIEELPVTRLPKVNLQINGVTIPALFDTGSPVTVINAQAAQEAGISTIGIGDISSSSDKSKDNNGSFNPLAGIAKKIKDAQATANAAARGDILSLAGTAGERVDLIKSSGPVEIQLASSSEDGNGDDHSRVVSFDRRQIYVGNIPGLAALDALGDDAPPAAVLGMDVLRSKPKMLLVACDQAVYL